MGRYPILNKILTRFRSCNSFSYMNSLGYFKSALIAGVLLVVLTSGCGSRKPVKVPDFNGDEAFSYLEKQVSFGPRVPGTEGSAACREYIISFFDSLGAKVDTLVFNHIDKITGKTVRMVNIIAGFSGKDKDAKRYLFAAHYDTRPRAEHDPDSSKQNEWIPGADDGASGVAVLMELGKLIAEQKPNAAIDFAILDGEDYGRPGDLDEYFLGAKDLVKRGIKGKYQWAITVDMVGDRDLKIYREEFSQKYFPDLNDMVWDIAKELGKTVFVDSVRHQVYDDHLSFMTIKLPAIVLIDFDYLYWHTTHDTPDKCSPASLDAVGDVLATLIYRL